MRTQSIFTLILTCLCASVAQGQHAQNAYYQASVGDISSDVALVGHCTSCDSAVCGCEAVPAEPTCGCGTGPTCGCDVAPAPAPSCGCDSGGTCGCAMPAAPAPSCGCGAPASACGCGAEPTCGCGAAPTCGCDAGICAAPEPTCGLPTAPTCGCDVGSMACDGGCDSACGGGGTAGGCPLGFGDCDLGDPFTLFGEANGISMGGWIQTGYHDRALPLFNSHPDRFNLHQAWLYAEKAADGSNGLGIGGRIDYVYGVDAQDTQAFGIDNDHWDNDWDNGIYGHSIPQLYVEAAYGDMSVKAGHFYTIIGWEVVTAPDNFFYSHAYTMYNSEPFTHTGALATVNASDNITLYGGYVLGWDSGFEDNGDAFLGGISLGLGENVALTYATTGGTFAEDGTGILEEGYMHSIVADVTLSDNLQYIFQSDLLDSQDASGLTVRDTFGINNYLIYSVNDCLAVGARMEWWQVSLDSQAFYGDVANPAALSAASTGLGEFDVTALTLGVNYKAHANVMVRPEIRWDWVDGDQAALATAGTSILESGDDQTTFGFDTIVTF